MSVDATVDLRNFRAAVDKALLKSGRELSEGINTRMYFLLRKALDNTKRARRQDIEKLGVYSFDVYTRKGTIRRKKQFVQAVEPNTMAFIRIHQAKNPNFASKFSSRAELQEAAKKWTLAKMRAIGFMASVWVKSIRRFSKFGKVKWHQIPQDATRNVPQHKNVRGEGRIARPGINPVAEALISIGSDAGGDPLRGYAQAIANSAMRAAMVSETAEIHAHLERKAKDACRDAGMTVR